jgi:hypothetical protein
MEAKPGTKLRDLCISILADAGYAGPPYNLDDIGAMVDISPDGAKVSFWDMNTFVSKNSDAYLAICKLAREGLGL